MSTNNLPLPYDDELLYSVIARARVHLLGNSPKKLLRTVFGHSSIVASMRFGSNLRVLANSYRSPVMSGETFLYKHTLWPMFAPFVPLERKRQCELWLLGQHDKAVTVASGLAASRLLYPKQLRYCPHCVAQQITEFGETYWQRIHQVAGEDNCIKHGCELRCRKSDNVQRNRHEYLPLTDDIESAASTNIISPCSKELNIVTSTLLNLEILKNPSFVQWSAYYKSLAVNSGYNKGLFINHQEIGEAIARQFSARWLQSIGLAINARDTNWARCLFRKHRTSFSFMEHYIVNRSITGAEWDVEGTLIEVSKYNQVRVVKPRRMNLSFPESDYEKYRQVWQRILILAGTKQARKIEGAAYAWLYRHDRPWLLSTNSDYRVPKVSNHHKVDWRSRDKFYAKLVIKIVDLADTDVESPRRTKTWLLAHFSNKPSLEKWLTKLPITKKLVEKYAETVPEYQIRRITRSILACKPPRRLQLWYLMRCSGLSKERLTPLARVFMKLMLEHSIVIGTTTSIEDS